MLVLHLSYCFTSATRKQLNLSGAVCKPFRWENCQNKPTDCSYCWRRRDEFSNKISAFEALLLFSRSRKVTSFSTIPPPRTGGVGMVYTVYNSSTRLIASKYSFIIRETLHSEILCIYKATRESFRRNCCCLVRLMSFLTHCDTFLNGLHYALPHFDTMLSLLDGIYLVLLLTPRTLSICYERSSRSSSRMRVLDIVVALLLLRT